MTTAPPEPVVIDLVARFGRLILITGALLVLIGLGSVAAIFLPGLDAVAQITLVGAGLVIGGLGVALLTMLRNRPRAAILVDPVGLTLDRPEGAAILNWDDLASFEILRQRGSTDFYHVKFRPSTEVFAAAHPELADLREADAYRYNIGPYRASARRLEAAVIRFRPELRLGIRTLGWSERP
ncbi:MAG TPA: hypothetical protein VFV67_05380 [Actinophytocola sp.]|uniref:hypothetical protein n=1 Tax=Actinophytocola sp. TaxID=1872138 RepID=UPI002DBEEF6F|nr:hypothetical protein [Actinophytocola sp.]HEU5470065.1 hypothetical protein [Actinophytocola sp.]